MSPGDRVRAVRRVLWAVLALNALVAIAKGVVAWLSGSLAVRADAFHSILDGASNVIGLVAITLAARGPDREHPYGHRKFEVLGAMGIGVLLALTAYNILGEAWRRWHEGAPPRADAFAFAVMGATFVVNAAVSAYERRRGRALASEILLADSAHTRSDLVATLAVVAALACGRAGIATADLAVAVLLAGFIVWTAWRVASTALGVLSDRAVLDPAQVARAAAEVPGVRACHDIRSRGTPDAVFADLRVHVDPATPLDRAHELAHRVEARLREAFPGLRDVVVHVEPHVEGHT